MLRTLIAVPDPIPTPLSPLSPPPRSPRVPVTPSVPRAVPLTQPAVTPDNVTVTENDSVALTCHPPPGTQRVSWLHLGAPVAPGGRLSLSPDNRTLTVWPVLRGDAGAYACRVSNAISANRSDDATVTVVCESPRRPCPQHRPRVCPRVPSAVPVSVPASPVLTSSLSPCPQLRRQPHPHDPVLCLSPCCPRVPTLSP